MSRIRFVCSVAKGGVQNHGFEIYVEAPDQMDYHALAKVQIEFLSMFSYEHSDKKLIAWEAWHEDGRRLATYRAYVPV